MRLNKEIAAFCTRSLIFWLLFLNPVLFFSFMIFLFVFSSGWNGWGVFAFSDISVLLFIVVGVAFFICMQIGKQGKVFIFLTCLASFLFFFVDNQVLLYLTFEGAIFPVVCLIIFWGNTFERFEAVYFLIFYRALRSYPALLGLFSEFYGPISLNFSLSSLWSFVFVFAFLVKLPIYFFHYWLPKAHVEAPSFGRIILAGLLLKLGGWGLLRMMNFVFFNIIVVFFIFFFLGGLLFAPFWASTHRDRKGLVAFSSICHINFMALIVVFNSFMSKSISVLIFLTHDIISGIIFWYVGIIYHISFRRQIPFLSSSLVLSLSFGSGFMFFILSNFGVPPFITFPHEIVFISFVFSSSFFVFIFICIYLVLVCYFCLFLSISIFRQKPASFTNRSLYEECCFFICCGALLNLFLFRLIFYSTILRFRSYRC